MDGIEEQRKSFDAATYIDRVARVSRNDGLTPDPDKAIGRECYAFSAEEDRAFSETEAVAREILSGLKEGTDFEIRRDPIGNMFVTLKAVGSNMPAIWCGSHVDSVANGGKYDGVAGVAVGLETLAELRDEVGRTRDFTVAVFRSEESSPRNSYACLGSAVATGLISKDDLNKIIYNRESGITFRQHIESTRGTEAWKAIENQLDTPVITRDSADVYLELHIEQSAVTSANKKDVGIVVDGIGGARREKVTTTLTPELVPTDSTHTKFSISFRGAPNHTGGTPPNRNFYQLPGVVWYRRDALVGASNMTNKLLQDPSIHLLRCVPPKATGFTSVPERQDVELLVPNESRDIVLSRIAELSRETKANLDIDVVCSHAPYDKKEAEVVSSERARKLLNIAQVVSALATKAFKEQGTETGTTRATVVDYYLLPDSITYNIDFREVNANDIEALIDIIHARTDLTLGEGAYTKISAKSHSPVSPEVVKSLTEHAEALGISFVLMPSMPGHDADRMAAIGIPVGMVFVEQSDGVSHSPLERMDPHAYRKASRVFRAATRKMVLGK